MTRSSGGKHSTETLGLQCRFISLWRNQRHLQHGLLRLMGKLQSKFYHCIV
ncbi:hypothetical protein Hanom_Chr08g00735701 [Helianthus anomalus]